MVAAAVVCYFLDKGLKRCKLVLYVNSRYFREMEK